MSNEQQYEVGNHPDFPPPVKQGNVLVWIKKNLFSTWYDSLLTLAFGYVLYLLLPVAISWVFINADFYTQGRDQCTSGGACWGVITRRIDQYLYGFYPPEQYWRPNLTGILLVVALLPVLWDKIPYRSHLLKFSMIYPIVAFWLLLGDFGFARQKTGIVTIIILLVLIGLPYVWKGIPFKRTLENLKVLFGLVVVFLLLGGYGFTEVESITIDGVTIFGFRWNSYPPVDSTKIGGITLTLVLGVMGIVLSLPVGIILALGRRSKMPAVRIICVIFIEFIRGVPMITLLFMATVLLPLFFPGEVKVDHLYRIIFIVVIFSSAYIAEVVRGGLQAITKGQYEAADALGLSYWQSMQLIILPQALKISIPGIVNTFIGLFKDTTLVILVGMFDLLGVGRAALSNKHWIGLSNEVYTFIAVCFFVFCYSMARYSLYLENKLKTTND